MKFLHFIVVLAAAIGTTASAQVRIDSSFAFSINPAKKYSLYIPSTYNPSTPHAVVVGFHPLNVTRWNAESWCDTLTAFAQAGNVILVCPDGDADGRITDQIDYDFTTALIDSVKTWYNVNNDRVYALGFSEGGKAVYEYGLQHTDVLHGFIPVGPAITGSSFVSSTIHNAGRRPFYLIHGALDNPNQGYNPMLTALRNECAYVDSLLMPGVAHTIDFPNRNAILGSAYHWVDSVNTSARNGVFSLIAPISFTSLDVKGFFENYLDFFWEKSSIADSCGVMKYEVMADVPGGSFSSPLFTIPADNGGSDTSLRLSFLKLDSILYSYGVTSGNNLTFDWTVRSILLNKYSDTAKAFRLTLIRRRIGFSLLSPANNNVVNLTNGDTRSFDWEDMLHFVPVNYALQFADTSANFSTPLATLSSGTGGSISFLSASHKDLYYNLMFGKGYSSGDTLETYWTAEATEGMFSQYAQKERAMVFVKGEVGFELFEPVDGSILQSKKNEDYKFKWDSITIPDVNYVWLFDTVGADLTVNPTIQKSSNGSGSMASLQVTYELLDSIMQVFGIPYEDTLHAQWSVRATNPDGSEFAMHSFEADIYRAHPVGIESKEDPVSFRVYPNPTSDQLHILITGNDLPERILIYDANGQIIQDLNNLQIIRNEVVISTAHLKEGTYFLNVKSERGLNTIPMVVQHR